MFVEDFCRSFSIKLAPIEQHDEFYDVSPADDLLKKLLTFDDYSFFRYSFDKLLDTLMYHLIFLDYMLQKLNNGFEPLRQEFGFVGRIITPLPRINYSQHLAEYHDGKINASQLGDVILKKNLRN